MMKKCLNNKTYKNNCYVCPKCGKDLIDVGSQTIKPTKPFKISDERAVGINESAGKVGC